jgi:hypothetical protein
MNEYGPVTAMETTGVLGVTAFEGADSGLSPAALLAWTVKVYVVPSVRPETVAVVSEAETLVLLTALPFTRAVTV